MLSKEKIQENKERIISLLKSTQRDGIDKVVDFLDAHHFFEMPSSLKRHHNWEGGLAQHCLGVYDRLVKTGPYLPLDSIKITSLLHDICKAGKIYKNEQGNWCEIKETDLKIPGHGSRSLRLLEDLGLFLTPDEKGAIRWHMGGWKIGEKSKDEIRDFFATKKSDLWRLHHNADRYDASHNGSDL